MSEATFALLGALVVFLGFVPAATLAAKAGLVLRRRYATDLAEFGSSTNLFLIVGPTLGAVVWFASAGLHQFEPGAAAAACVTEHLGDEGCVGALSFTLAIVLVTAVAFVRRLRREQASSGRPVPSADPRAQRLAALCGARPSLRGLRVVLVEGAADALGTRGLLRPAVEIDATLLGALDDDALAAALLHEGAHVAARDPLRQLAASVGMALNPLAVLLRPEMARWRLAREAACDRAAVCRGADPLALAEALLAAARPAAAPAPILTSTLGAGGFAALQARIQLLVEYDRVRPIQPRLVVPTMGLATLTLSTSPHALGTGLLDALHLGIEVALTAVIRW